MKIKLLFLAAALGSHGLTAMGPGSLTGPLAANTSSIADCVDLGGCTGAGCWGADFCIDEGVCAVEEVFQQAEVLMCSSTPLIPGQTGILTTAADTAIHTLQDATATPGLQEQATAVLSSILEYAQATDNTYLGGYLQHGLGYLQHGLGTARDLCYEYPQTAVVAGVVVGGYLLSKAFVHARKCLSARCKRSTCESRAPKLVSQKYSRRGRSGTIGSSNQIEVQVDNADEDVSDKDGKYAALDEDAQHSSDDEDADTEEEAEEDDNAGTGDATLQVHAPAPDAVRSRKKKRRTKGRGRAQTATKEAAEESD